MYRLCIRWLLAASVVLTVAIFGGCGGGGGSSSGPQPDSGKRFLTGTIPTGIGPAPMTLVAGTADASPANIGSDGSFRAQVAATQAQLLTVSVRGTADVVYLSICARDTSRSAKAADGITVNTLETAVALIFLQPGMAISGSESLIAKYKAFIRNHPSTALLAQQIVRVIKAQNKLVMDSGVTTALEQAVDDISQEMLAQNTQSAATVVVDPSTPLHGVKLTATGNAASKTIEWEAVNNRARALNMCFSSDGFKAATLVPSAVTKNPLNLNDLMVFMQSPTATNFFVGPGKKSGTAPAGSSSPVTARAIGPFPFAILMGGPVAMAASSQASKRVNELKQLAAQGQLGQAVMPTIYTLVVNFVVPVVAVISGTAGEALTQAITLGPTFYAKTLSLLTKWVAGDLAGAASDVVSMAADMIKRVVVALVTDAVKWLAIVVKIVDVVAACVNLVRAQIDQCVLSVYSDWKLTVYGTGEVHISLVPALSTMSGLAMTKADRVRRYAVSAPGRRENS